MTDSNLALQLQHIAGWGSDIRRREGTHGATPLPMGKGPTPTGEPTPQVATVEILTSTERDGLTPVFGATVPPSGLSGMCRRWAFKFSENDLRHWLLLLFADRVNVGEGLVSDLSQGHVPNLFAEMGAKAEWQHNKPGVARKAAVLGVVVVATLWLVSQRRRSHRVNRAAAPRGHQLQRSPARASKR